jgi:hypothetical protein
MLRGSGWQPRCRAPSLVALLVFGCLPDLPDRDSVAPPGDDAGTSSLGPDTGDGLDAGPQGPSADAGVTPPVASLITLEAIEAGSARGYMLQDEAFRDNFGVSLAAAGDVNGDGFADFIIGAPGPSEGGVGRAFVIFGSPDRSRPTLTALGERGFVIDGAAPGANAGRFVSGAGDVNGDGLDDVLISAAGADQAPEVYVVFGKVDVAPVSLAALGAGGFPIRGFTVEGGIPGDGNGIIAAAAGDTNGDGLGDVILGALTNDYNPDLPFGGYAFVVFGKRADVAPVLVDALGAGGFRINDILREYRTPLQVARAGDFNGDGLDDVLVGGAVGGARVVYGKRDVQEVFLASSGFDTFAILGNGDEGDHSVSAAGDVNGDGFDDVLVGEPLATHPVSDPASGQIVFARGGNAYVVFGRDPPGQARLSDIEATSQEGFAIYAVDEGDGIGVGLASAGDVNGDGYADLLLSAEGAWAGPESEKPAVDDCRSYGCGTFGAAYVVFGKPDTSQRTSLAAIEAGGPAGIVFAGRRRSDIVGDSIAGAGDIDGDGFDDILIGAPEYEEYDGEDPISFDSRGKVYVVFGGDDFAVSVAIRERPTLRGNRADDAFVLNAGSTEGIIINGGNGHDRLSPALSSLELHLEQGSPPGAAASARSVVKSIETIDLTGAPGATLVLDEAAIRRLPQSESALPFGLAKRLVVRGTVNNTLRTPFDLSQWDRLGTDQGLDVYRPVGSIFGAFYGIAVSPELTLAPASPQP